MQFIVQQIKNINVDIVPRVLEHFNKEILLSIRGYTTEISHRDYTAPSVV